MRRTQFQELTGLEHPIVQGPFGGGLSTVALTSLVSNHGGLGSFGAHMLNAGQGAPLLKHRSAAALMASLIERLQ